MAVIDQIDPTSFKTLLRHLQNDPEISSIIQVFDDLDLAVAGEEFKKENGLSRIEAWMKEGKINVYADCNIGRNKNVAEVSPIQAVDCLYLPPFYLFKDRKQLWI